MKNYIILFLSTLTILLSFKAFHCFGFEQCQQEYAQSYTSNLNPDPLSDEYKAYLSWLEKQYDLPEGLLWIVMLKESSGNANVVSPAGAEGLFQFMPKTSSWLQIDPFNPYEAANGAAKYLKYLIDYFDGSVELGLAAYNAGMGNVKKYSNKIPPFKETQHYVAYITSKMNL